MAHSIVNSERVDRFEVSEDGLPLAADNPAKDKRVAMWLLIAVVSLLVAFTVRLHAVTHDAFHEMALVRAALAEGRFPVEDIFAFTPTKPLAVHHEWGTGLVLYFATVGTGLGPIGMAALRLLLIVTLVTVLYDVARRRGATPAVFAIASLLVFPMLWVGFATIRAQLFTLVFLSMQMWMLELDRSGKRVWIIGWLCMLLVWLNMHAGFVVGLGMIAFHTIEQFVTAMLQKRSVLLSFQRIWHLIVAAPIAAALLVVNPYGSNYVLYLWHGLRMPRPAISEWKPLWHSFAPETTMICFILSVITAAICLRFAGEWSKRVGGPFLLLCAWMALKHIRHGSIYAIVWMAYVPAWISRQSFGRRCQAILNGSPKPTIRVCQALSGAAICFSAYHHVWLPSLPGIPVYSPYCYPTSAVAYLKESGFSGNLLTPFHAGSYVSWEMYPAVKVSLDGRYEVAYEESVFDEHQDFFRANGQWWELLDRYAIDAALIHRNSKVADELEELESVDSTWRDSWRIVYKDPSYLVLAPSHSPLIAQPPADKVIENGIWSVFTRDHSYRPEWQ